jgi:hypothetical protein
MDDKELESLIPQMNVNVPAPQSQEEEKALIPDEVWMGWCNEVMNNLRQERQEVDEVKHNFIEMVINEGDSTSASKEALTKLFEIKAGISEKMTKVLDLATRVKLKERDTFPRYLAAHQNNTINLGDSSAKRELIKQINKIQKQKEANDGQNKS